MSNQLIIKSIKCNNNNDNSKKKRKKKSSQRGHFQIASLVQPTVKYPKILLRIINKKRKAANLWRKRFNLLICHPFSHNLLVSTNQQHSYTRTPVHSHILSMVVMTVEGEEQGIQRVALCVPCCCSFSIESAVPSLASIYSTIYSEKREEASMQTQG